MNYLKIFHHDDGRIGFLTSYLPKADSTMGDYKGKDFVIFFDSLLGYFLKQPSIASVTKTSFLPVSTVKALCYKVAGELYKEAPVQQKHYDRMVQYIEAAPKFDENGWTELEMDVIK